MGETAILNATLVVSWADLGMAGQTLGMRGTEVQNQGVAMGQIHLDETETTTRNGNAAETLPRVGIMIMTKIEMAEIETDLGLVMVIDMNVMAKIGIGTVMIVVMIKILIEKEIIADHVIGTMIKIGTEIVTEDTREIVTGTMTTRIEQEIVKNGVGTETSQRIITVMKLYTYSLSFLHVTLFILSFFPQQK